MRHVAGLDAVERTVLGAFKPLFHPIEERAVDSPSRHADGTFDDLDVLRFGVEIGLLEGRIGVALLGGHEARAHLHAVGAQLHDTVDILAGVDAAARDDGNMAVVFGTESAHLGDDFGNEGFERKMLVGELLLLVSEVTARLGAFDDDGVGNVPVLREPLLTQQFRRTRRRHDRGQLGLGALREERRQVERQAGARKDDVGLLGDGGLHHVGEVRHGDHNVYADDAPRGFAGLAKLLLKPPDRGCAVVFRIVVVDGSETCRRNDADAALIGNGRSQSGEGYAYAHAALHDGDGGEQISDFQCFHVKLGLVRTK